MSFNENNWVWHRRVPLKVAGSKTGRYRRIAVDLKGESEIDRYDVYVACYGHQIPLNELTEEMAKYRTAYFWWEAEFEIQ